MSFLAVVFGEDMASKRKTLSKKTRFEVFKRDGFKCQYCGATSPEAVLEVDHIDPVSKDGADEMMNYITACKPCNAGKSDRLLSDDAAIKKQRAQLEELAERREQLEMMVEWRDGLAEIGHQALDAVCDGWAEVVPGFKLNETGCAEARKLLKKYGAKAVLDAIDTAGDSYVKLDAEGRASVESANLAWSKVGGILRMSALPEETQRLHYVKGILRKRLPYVPYEVIRDLERALQAGVSVEDMTHEAKRATSWSRFSFWLSGAS